MIRRKHASFAVGVLGVMLAGASVRGWDADGHQRTREVIINSIGMVLVFVPSGSYLMGCDTFAESSPVHSVTVRGFWIGQYEVTNGEYDQYRKRPRPPESRTDRQPATRISWYDAVKFCRWLSRKERRRYRLPTEAEWEYAARGGLSQKEYPWGNALPFGRAAVNRLTTTPVGTYAPNGFGLYDVAGNVEEWVSDWYDEAYYTYGPRRDPSGPVTSPLGPVRKEPLGFKITRGGSYGIWENYCWLRTPADPHERDEFLGFRVVLDVYGTERRHPPAAESFDAQKHGAVLVK